MNSKLFCVISINERGPSLHQRTVQQCKSPQVFFIDIDTGLLKTLNNF